MKVRASDLLIVRVSVRGTAKIQPHQNDDLPRAGLIFPFEQVNTPPADVEQKLFSLVRRLQRNDQ